MEHSNTLVRPLDPCTFGKGGLAHSLAGILNERNDRHLTNKVSGFLTDYRKILKEVSRIENYQAFEYVLCLVRTDFLRKAERYEGEGVLYTHLRNFIVARYRDLLRTRTQLTRTGRRVPLPDQLLPATDSRTVRP